MFHVEHFIKAKLKMTDQYDIIIAGAGHAGCEAACAAANMGSRVLLITMNLNTIAQMSCNPAVGGVAKGQIVREIDALGGYSGIIADKTALQFRMLNRSKGPAMWSPRTQNDRFAFAAAWRETIDNTPNVFLWQDTVVDLLSQDDAITGVRTAMGMEFAAKAVIVTSGTFLNGTVHIGTWSTGGGRTGERAAHGLTEALLRLGFEAGRMKTGTPPRIEGKSLDYTLMEPQFGDENPSKFSYGDTLPAQNQLPCWITYTNGEVHDVLKTGFDRSPMYQGRIQGLGPRYCPSIEDKINRFAERDRHQLFVEPEGRHTTEMYVNGFSTSLPFEVQVQALRSVPGFANAHFLKPGYAIEYDYFPPTQLHPTMETKLVAGLYFAGQINGTTGYEEAACQGLMAGINAHLKLQGETPLLLSRAEAYIGVLIDDLVNKGTDEPYRMFTSRAEHRLLLRQDNADIRLSEIGYRIGLLPEGRIIKVREKVAETARLKKALDITSAEPAELNPYLEANGTAPITQRVRVASLITRPQVNLQALLEAAPTLQAALGHPAPDVVEQAEIDAKYATYIEQEREHASKLARLDQFFLPDGFDYGGVTALSKEAREKLSRMRPLTLGQAGRISGVNPADISVLLVVLGR